MPRPRNPDRATQAQQRLEQRNLTTKIAYRLGINPYTLTNWCVSMGIDIDDYRYAQPDETGNLPVPV